MKITVSNPTASLVKITITSKSGQIMSFLNVGASLLEWILPDKTQITASYQDPLAYLKPGMYLGCNIGLNCGRIANGTFSILSKKYIIEPFTSCLHFGKESFAFLPFDYQILKQDETEVVLLFTTDYTHSLLPGHQHIEIKYTIKENNLLLAYDVSSDTLTLCNITNHSYFNLDGSFHHPLENQTLRMNVKQVVIPNKNMIGEQLLEIQDSIYDFTHQRDLLESIQNMAHINPHIRGIDHYFLFDPKGEHTVVLESIKKKRRLTVTTDYPGVTIYSTNFPSDSVIHKGSPLQKHAALAIEPSYQSNAINDARFACGMVSKDKPYHHQIHYLLEENI